MTALKRWLERTGFTQVDLEAATGIGQSLISKYVRGEWVPGTCNALKIEKATGGAVLPSSWGNIEDELRKVKPLVPPAKAARSKADS